MYVCMCIDLMYNYIGLSLENDIPKGGTPKSLWALWKLIETSQFDLSVPSEF